MTLPTSGLIRVSDIRKEIYSESSTRKFSINHPNALSIANKSPFEEEDIRLSDFYGKSVPFVNGFVSGTGTFIRDTTNPNRRELTTHEWALVDPTTRAVFREDIFLVIDAHKVEGVDAFLPEYCRFSVEFKAQFRFNMGTTTQMQNHPRTLEGLPTFEIAVVDSVGFGSDQLTNGNDPLCKVFYGIHDGRFSYQSLLNANKSPDAYEKLKIGHIDNFVHYPSGRYGTDEWAGAVVSRNRVTAEMDFLNLTDDFSTAWEF